MAKNKKNKKNKKAKLEVVVDEEESARQRGQRSQMAKHEALAEYIEEVTGEKLSSKTPAEILAAGFAHRVAWRKTDGYQELQGQLSAQREAAKEARIAARAEKEAQATKEAVKANKKGKGKGKEKAESNGSEETDISKLTIPKLRELAAEKGVEVPAGRIRKEALLELINSAGDKKGKKAKKSKVTKDEVFA